MTAYGFESADRSSFGHAWREDAACRGEPPERFTEPAETDDLRQALATCASCPVREPCLQTALSLERDADLGVWGGTTETTRHRIRDGRLSVDDALRRPAPTGERRVAEVVPTRQAFSGPGSPMVAAGPEQLRKDVTPMSEDVPMITVSRDKYGDYTDETGRVIIFRIHGEPPWMLMIDGRCHARTSTLSAAQQAAWKSRYLVGLEPSHVTDCRSADVVGRRAMHRR